MKAKELIKILEKFPDDADVQIETDAGYADIKEQDIYEVHTVQNDDFIIIDISVH